MTKQASLKLQRLVDEKRQEEGILSERTTARRIGISRPTLHAIINGHGVRKDVLPYVCQWLGIGLEDLE